jgi:hypothetical protein
LNRIALRVLLPRSLVDSYQPLADDYEVAVTAHSTNQAPQMFRSATRRGVRVPAGGL